MEENKLKIKDLLIFMHMQYHHEKASEACNLFISL
jgi:hypothetical protein